MLTYIPFYACSTNTTGFVVPEHPNDPRSRMIPGTGCAFACRYQTNSIEILAISFCSRPPTHALIHIWFVRSCPSVFFSVCLLCLRHLIFFWPFFPTPFSISFLSFALSPSLPLSLSPFLSLSLSSTPAPPSFSHIRSSSIPWHYLTLVHPLFFTTSTKYLKFLSFTSTHLLSYQIISGHFILHHNISYNIVSYQAISYCIITYHIILYHIRPYHIASYNFITYHIISYQAISYCIISYNITSCHIISWYIIMPYHIVTSYYIRSYHIISYGRLIYHIIPFHVIF